MGTTLHLPAHLAAAAGCEARSAGTAAAPPRPAAALHALAPKPLVIPVPACGATVRREALTPATRGVVPGPPPSSREPATLAGGAASRRPGPGLRARPARQRTRVTRISLTLIERRSHPLALRVRAVSEADAPPGPAVAVAGNPGKGGWCRRLAQVRGARGHPGAGPRGPAGRGGRHRQRCRGLG